MRPEAGAGLMRWLKGMMLKHIRGMITCREFEEFIHDYLAGELPAAKVKVFEWHLNICRECREYLAAYRVSIEIGNSALASPDAPPPDDVPQDLIRAVLDARDR